MTNSDISQILTCDITYVKFLSSEPTDHVSYIFHFQTDTRSCTKRERQNTSKVTCKIHTEETDNSTIIMSFPFNI